MGRLLKFGTTAGLKALKEAEVSVPDAICTGTGFGLLDDSGKFLKNVTEANEGVVSPTSFIQSTHNTVSSNIALIVGCKTHNNTFTHKGFSFETALTDAQLIMGESDAIQNVLAGAYDETTDYSFDIMKRLKLIRKDATNSDDLFTYRQAGTIAGEGSAFYVLSKIKQEASYAEFHGTSILFNPSSAEVLAQKLDAFLKEREMTIADVDVLLSGICGDQKRDEKLIELNENYFSNQTIIGYKQLCGEYMTSSAFALWLGSMMAKTGSLPDKGIIKDAGRKLKIILICNAYKKGYTFTLLSAIK